MRFRGVWKYVLSIVTIFLFLGTENYLLHRQKDTFSPSTQTVSTDKRSNTPSNADDSLATRIVQVFITPTPTLTPTATPGNQDLISPTISSVLPTIAPLKTSLLISPTIVPSDTPSCVSQGNNCGAVNQVIGSVKRVKKTTTTLVNTTVGL